MSGKEEPSRHKTLNECCIAVGLPSLTLADINTTLGERFVFGEKECTFQWHNKTSVQDHHVIKRQATLKIMLHYHSIEKILLLQNYLLQNSTSSMLLFLSSCT